MCKPSPKQNLCQPRSVSANGATHTIDLTHLEAMKYDFSHSHTCDWREKLRPYATIALMLEGMGKFVTRDEAFIIRGGDMVFIPDGINYISHWQGNPNSYISIHFLFKSAYPQCEARNFKLQKLSGMEAAFSALDKIRASLENSDGGMAAAGAFFTLYSNIMHRLKPSKCYNSALKSVQRAIDFLETDWGNINVGQLAEMCHLSESRFYTLFRQATGISPIKYKNNILIRRSIRLLKSGMPIQIVSDELGFSSPSYFRRIFKQATGKNPKEYIKSIYL